MAAPLLAESGHTAEALRRVLVCAGATRITWAIVGFGEQRFDLRFERRLARIEVDVFT